MRCQEKEGTRGAILSGDSALGRRRTRRGLTFGRNAKCAEREAKGRIFIYNTILTLEGDGCGDGSG